MPGDLNENRVIYYKCDIFGQAINQTKLRTIMMFFLNLSLFVTIITSSMVFFLFAYDHTVLGIEPQSIYFEQEINISKNNGTSELPQVTAEGNNVYVVWQDNTTGNYDINFKSSSTNGTNFKSTRNLSKNNGTSVFPLIESYKDVFYVIWNDGTSGKDRIYFKEGRKDESTNATEFGSLTKVPNNNSVSKPAINGGTNYFSIVWISDLANASVIGFYPLNFFDDSSDIIQLTKLSPKYNMSNISIFGYDFGIYIVWEIRSNSGGEIFFKRTSTTSLD